MGSTVFTPDMEKPIRVVKQYDSTLKYALFTFGIVRDIDDNDVGMNNIDKAACIVTVCVFVCHLFSCYPFYFDFHSARIIFDVSFGFYLWNINKTTADICKRC